MESAELITQRDNNAPDIHLYGMQVFQHFAKLPINEWAITPPLEEEVYALPER